MYTWFFLCIFVVTLICSQINASNVNKYNFNSLGGGKYSLRDTPSLSDRCQCQAARNDYTYRYPDVARLNIDPVYHYLNENLNETFTWNCVYCNERPIYHNSSKCQCDAVIARYSEDYTILTDQYAHYAQNTAATGVTWHCELCILDYNLTCMEARIAYRDAYLFDVNIMDEVFHYITYGYNKNFTWPSQACGPTSLYPIDRACQEALATYTMYHPNTWNLSAVDHYLKYHLTIGWRLPFQRCDALGRVTTSFPTVHCSCVVSKLHYWSNYPDVYAIDMDPFYHWQNYYSSEKFRIMKCDWCATNGNELIATTMSSSMCKCDAAVKRFNDTYPLDLGFDPFTNYFFSLSAHGYAWHCELCQDFSVVLDALYKSNTGFRHMVPSTTCIAGRENYLRENPEVKAAGLDPVWHYETIGFYKRMIWDQSPCINNPQFITNEQICGNCPAANAAYVKKYPIAATYVDPYKHWRSFYLRTNRTNLGYTFPCAEYCDFTRIPNSTISTTGPSIGPTIPPTATPTVSPTITPTIPPTIPPTLTPTTTTTTSTTIGNPAPPVSTSTTGEQGKSDSGSGLETNAVLAIVVPIAAVLSVGIGMLFIHQQRRQAVQALIKAEEGERRNYKIDYMSLSIDWLIGSGNFGHVYRGEYRGADVAIKKLKKQTLGNQQLEDLAKESAVMVGLRHPNIVLFMGVCLERPELCIVTEYMPRGNLYDVLHDSTIKLPFNVVRNMALHVVKGLQFIHSSGLIHRDLKSPNLLVDANWTIKIADFGLSCAKAQVTDDAQISLLWTAPEILMREKGCYSEKSDIYSLGIILWELMSRQTPFNEYISAAIPPVIVLGKRPPVSSEWNPTMKVLMMQCWSQLPNHRPTVRDVRVNLDNINIQDMSTIDEGSINSSMGSEMSVFPPRGAVTLVFIDVTGSADLWEASPSTMLTALKLFNETSKKLLKEHGGYKASAEGDAVMLAFSDTTNAVNYCISLQLALLKIEWPSELLKQPAAEEEWNDENVCLYRGLRLRMGMHTGIPHCEQDQINLRTEYFGPVVNTAARIVSRCAGGQIMASAEVYNIIASSDRLEPCVVEQSGFISIKGGDIQVYSIWPQSLKGRHVKMLDLTNNNNNNNNNNTNNTFSTINSTTTTTHNSNNNNFVNNSRSVQYSMSGSSRSQTTSMGNETMDYEEEKYAWNLRHNEKWIISYDDLELDVVIGTGSFGDVYSGTWKGQQVAIKQFMKQNVTDEILLEMRTESGILSAIEHPNVIRFLGMCIKIPHLCIVTELLGRGSLSTLLLGDEELSWERRKNFATDIARGLEYLHSNNIIHRDVKSPNMLVAADWTVRIGDFGFSRVKSESHTMTQCGTVAWTAPEIFLGERYSEKADVYSYSVILWELVFRRKPWQGLNSMKVCAEVEKGGRLPLDNPPPGTPDYMIKLMQSCWLHEHESRPSFTEVLKFLEQQR